MFARAAPRAGCRIAQQAHHNQPQLQTLAKLPSRAWRPAQQRCTKRHQSTFSKGFTEQFRKSPIAFPFAVLSIVGLLAFAGLYIPWHYRTFIVKPYHNFPEPVAKKLRRAVFYARKENLDVRESMRYFRQALQTANEVGMDPFSPEILGIKYTMSLLLEQAGIFGLSSEILEIMRMDCYKWMDEYSDKRVENGDRSRVRKVIVQVCVKLGQMYDSKYWNEPDNAEKRLVEAVEIILKEKRRRETEGIKEGEGEFMTDEEVGGTMEALAQHYEAFDAHYLATPLFVQALTLIPANNCHSVVIMNNIATCLAQQKPPPVRANPSKKSSSDKSFSTAPAPPREVLISHAKQWADKALARAAAIKPPERNEECDMGCAVATHNLGEFLEMEGNIKEAARKYKEAASLAKGLGFKEGQMAAKLGIDRLKELDGWVL